MSDEEDSLDLDLIPSPVRPLVTPEQAAHAWQIFLDLKQKLLTKEDYQLISGKRFITKSGFRKLSVCFNLSDRIVEQERTDREDGSFFWRIVVEVQAPNGRVCTGVGICDSRERKFTHVEHDVFATCHTRSKNRAISDMVAGGVVSAEEMGKQEDSHESIKERPQPEDKDPDFDKILRTIERAGLDTKDLEVNFDLEAGGIVVRLKAFLGKEVWQEYNTVLERLGMKWISSGKDSHWKGV